MLGLGLGIFVMQAYEEQINLVAGSSGICLTQPPRLAGGCFGRFTEMITTLGQRTLLKTVSTERLGFQCVKGASNLCGFRRQNARWSAMPDSALHQCLTGHTFPDRK